MNKLILPILLGIFAMFFSGTTAPVKKCGPGINLDNLAGMGVRMVEIINTSAGVSNTYYNPTFPLIHVEIQGMQGQYIIRFTFDHDSDGVLQLNGNPIENFREKGSVETSFYAWCGSGYDVNITN
ncbi:hypothetical protein [Niastella sp. OAS944]|uniref:hypothetical protein n=1 Tax=Niastella sp. OAS944 TaxID=2664089 RepID=UPI00346DEF8D|nr:hypothetical protein [Chitinophagaceae bacterium OAS944]